jgi:hypothetical protein
MVHAGAAVHRDLDTGITQAHAIGLAFVAQHIDRGGHQQSGGQSGQILRQQRRGLR